MDVQAVAIRRALKEWWEARATREKQLLGIGAALGAVAMIYCVLWSPAVDGNAKISASLPGLETELADVRLQVDEARRLRASSAVSAPSGQALRDALAASLEAAALGKVDFSVIDKTVQIEARDVPFGAWFAWLDDARRHFHVRVTSAHVTGIDKTGHVAVSVTLQPAAG